jgi:hypothetical protein
MSSRLNDDNIMFSCGDHSMDSYCMDLSRGINHSCIIISFNGHLVQYQHAKTYKIKPEDIEYAWTQLRDHLSYTCDDLCMISHYHIQLLARCHIQFWFIHTLYVVGDFTNNNRHDIIYVNIKGHHAHAIHMFIQRFKKDAKIPLYFYSKNEKKWFKCHYFNRKIHWRMIDTPPKPHGWYCFNLPINLTDEEQQTIKSLF